MNAAPGFLLEIDFTKQVSMLVSMQKFHSLGFNFRICPLSKFVKRNLVKNPLRVLLQVNIQIVLKVFYSAVQNISTCAGRQKKKNCLVFLHCSPLIFENGKKFLLYKSIPHLISKSQKKGFFSLWEFWSFQNIFRVVVVNLFTI